MEIGNNDIKYSELTQKIESGSFGMIYLAKNQPTSTQIAIKVIDKSTKDDPVELVGKNQTISEIENEIAVLKTLDHPFTSYLYNVSNSSQKAFISMEIISGGSLLDAIQNENRLPEVKARKYFTQIIFALKYLHETLNIIHRDLKLENILIDQNDFIRLIDFGFAQKIPENPTEPIPTKCGTIDYVAPEILRTGCCTQAADIWSLGIILYSLVVGQFPFSGANDNEIMQSILKERLELPIYVSKQLGTLITSLLQKNPDERMKLNEIFEHPWLACNSAQFRDIEDSLSRQSYTKIDLAILQKSSELISNHIDQTLDVDQIMEKLRKYIIAEEFNEFVEIYRILNRKNAMDKFNTTYERLTKIPKTRPHPSHSVRRRINSLTDQNSAEQRIGSVSPSPDLPRNMSIPKLVSSPQIPAPSSLVSPPNPRKIVQIAAHRRSNNKISAKSPSLTNIC